MYVIARYKRNMTNYGAIIVDVTHRYWRCTTVASWGISAEHDGINVN